MITRFHQLLGDASRHRRHLAVARILGPGPEEASEAVLPPPGHDVHVQVGDALADDVVLGHEAPLGLHSRPDGEFHPLDLAEERPHLVLREVGQSLDVLPGQDQRVAGEERPVIEKGHDVVGVEHEVGGDLPRDDLAELAAGRHSADVYGRSRGFAASRLGTITLRRK